MPTPLTPTLTTLVYFNGTNGQFPVADLIADANGDLFGTTASGGTNGDGTVFEITKTSTGYASTPTTLVSFTSDTGIGPECGLIADGAGNLYGTTVGGGTYGDGTVFEVVKTSTGYSSTPTVLFSFDGANGANPIPGLIADAAGNLYGTTQVGGAKNDGTVFEIAKTSTGYASAPTVLVSFNGANGINPDAGLIADAAGNLFGTTGAGGANNYGTVFEIAKTSTGYASAPTILVSFNGTNGQFPAADLIADANGDLFGTTSFGGTTGYGTVFEITKTSTGYANTPTVLVSFNGANGEKPLAGLIADAAGNLYGTTQEGGASGDGTVFEIAKTNAGYASTPTVLVSFNGANNGESPDAGLIADANGDLFGTTGNGIGGNGFGTVLEIAGSGFQVAPPTPPTVAPDRAHVQVAGTVTANAANGVLANDTDPIPNDTLMVSRGRWASRNVGHAVAGTYGTLTINADGSYSYSANGPHALPSSGVGEDIFTYTDSTGQGGMASSTLSVVVTAAGLTYVAVPAGGSATQANGGHSAVLDGGAGNATLTAANGVGAVLIGGPRDTLNGANSGKDTFVFAGDFGQNTINNYVGKANGNYDVIQLDHSEFANLAAVQRPPPTKSGPTPSSLTLIIQQTR